MDHELAKLIGRFVYEFFRQHERWRLLQLFKARAAR
jgi:hypothetical protein